MQIHFHMHYLAAKLFNFSKHHLSTFIAMFFCFCASANADQLIIEPDMGRAPILSAINSANNSLHLVMYGFTDQTLLDALLKQKKQGRELKIILERSPYRTESENSNTITLLNKNNVDWIGSIQGIRLIHQKTLLIDNKKALVMTFNFTHSSFDTKASHPQRNFALLLDNQTMVNDIEKVFNTDWHQSQTRITNENLIFSPENSRVALLHYLDHATSSIQMYAQQVSDYKIIGALSNAAKRGVKVELLLAKKLTDKEAQYLERAGVIVKLSTYYYIHAKVMIIDNEIAILGSINSTKASIDDNRELSVVNRNPSIIKTLNTTFAHDWQLAESRATQVRINSRQISKILKLMQS